MNPVVIQQVKLDNALVAPTKRLKIKRCNARIEFNKPPKKETLPNQEFVDPPSEDELMLFIKDLGYSGRCEMLDFLEMHLLMMAANVDYVALLWEDFMYQADNRDITSTRKEHMPYPKFTKVIINHFISKDNIISIRNIINLYNIHDDSLLGSLKFVSKTKDYQKYGALIPDGMINQDIKDSKAFKTCYDVSTGKATRKKARKFMKVVLPSNKFPPVLEEGPAKKSKRVKIPAKKSTSMPNVGVVIRDTPGVSVSKKKVPAKDDIGKGIELLSNAALLKAAQLKKVPNESKSKSLDTSEGTGVKPRVLDVSQVNSSESESDNKSWGDSEDDEEDDDGNEDDSANDNDDGNETHDSARTDSDDVKNLSFTLKDDEEEEYDKERSNDLLSSRLGYATQTALQSYTIEFKKKAQSERKRYIDLVEKSMKDIIKDEVKSQLLRILPKEVSDFSTLVIERTVTESLDNVLLAKSSSQPQSTYEAAATLTEFKLNKILLDKIQRSESYKTTLEHKELYEGPIKYSNLDKDLFLSYGTKTQPKSSGKSAQAKGPVFKAAHIKLPQNHETDMDYTDDQPNVKAASQKDWFKKSERPPTPDPDWNAKKSIDFRPSQTWISRIAQAKKLTRHAFNLLKGRSSLIRRNYHNYEFGAYAREKLMVEKLVVGRRLVTDDEIKSAMFSIGDDRAPGPDGFLLLKEINHTFLALIPKVLAPLKVTDHRPISCCNVIYKCISKIHTNHIINGIKEVVSDNQSAFVLGRVLECFGFHPRMIKWIMVCVTSTSFSLSLNGDIHGFFKGKRDDLFIFARGDVESARIIMEALESLKVLLGLVPSLPKCTAFFCNVPNHIKLAILNIMPITEGKLPVKYLRVPLILSRLLNKDCKIIVDRVKNKIEDWKNKSLLFAEFSVRHAWEALRPRGNEDKLRHWDVDVNTDLTLLPCPLCNTQQDSHAHLFFECVYSAQVWKLVRYLTAIEMIQPILQDITAHLQPMARKRTTRSIIGKLVLAATSYFVWIEHNNRLFKRSKRTPEDLRDSIMITVRLKLLSFRFKKKATVREMLDRWKMPKAFRVYDT
nr:hypothetical protein [Tanacetum cinerariifolium]